MYTPVVDRTHPMGMGVQHIYRFDNGYGASVVKTPYTYGGSKDRWELAVVRFESPDDNLEFQLVYDTGITEDVVGWLDDEGVESYLERIEALPAREDALG